MRFTNRLAVFTLAAIIAACASLPDRGGRPDVEAFIQERGRPSQSSDEVKSLLASMPDRTLTVADAVHIALVNSPRVRALYAELGLAASEVYEAGRLSNPRLSASVLFPTGAGEKVTLGLAQSFTDLLLVRRRGRLAEAEFKIVQQRAGSELLGLASDVEAAYFEGVGASMIVTIRKAIERSATASAQLAQRFHDAGNLTKLQLAQEQAAAAQAAIARLDAEAALSDDRAKLNVLMGIPPADRSWQFPSSLSEPLPVEDAYPDLLRTADSRLDLRAARAKVGALRDRLGITQNFRYLGDLELGVEMEREPDGTHLTGPTLELELPIFNTGAGRTAAAAAELERAEADLAALEIEVVNELRRNQSAVAVSRTRVDLYRSTLVPLREAVVARTQEQVNFMLAGQFELLLAKRDEYEAYEGLLTALRDYWLARTHLARSVGAQLPSSASPVGGEIDADALTAPAKPEAMNHTMPPMDHSMEGMDMDGMEGMDHSMDGMEPAEPPAHSHETQKPAVQKRARAKAAAPPKTEMPSGMEGHIPAPASEPAEKHSHGDH